MPVAHHRPGHQAPSLGSVWGPENGLVSLLKRTLAVICGRFSRRGMLGLVQGFEKSGGGGWRLQERVEEASQTRTMELSGCCSVP